MWRTQPALKANGGSGCRTDLMGVHPQHEGFAPVVFHVEPGSWQRGIKLRGLAERNPNIPEMGDPPLNDDLPELKARTALAIILSALGALYWYQHGLFDLLEADRGIWRALNCIGLSLPFAMLGFALVLGRFWKRLPNRQVRLRNPSNLVLDLGREAGSFGCSLGCLGCLGVPLLSIASIDRLCWDVASKAPWFLVGLLGAGLWISYMRHRWVELDRESGQLIDHRTVGGMQFTRVRPTRVIAVALAYADADDASRVVTFFLNDGNLFELPAAEGLNHRTLYRLGLAYRVPVLKEVLRSSEARSQAQIFRNDPKSVQTLSSWGSVTTPEGESQLPYGSLPPVD